jgi:1,2-diacylglycerol 3-alpha-glucosyltransferase
VPRKDLPQKLKIALVSPKFTIGGASSSQGFVWPILRELAQQGHQVHVLAWTNSLGEPIVKTDNVQISFISEVKKNKNILEFPRLIREVFLEEHRNSPYHIMHSLTRDGFLLARERKQYGFATAFDIQATSMAQLYSLIGMSEETPFSKIRNGLKISYTFLKNYIQKDRALLGAADAAFVTSLQQRWILERYYLYPPMHTFTIPYSLDLHDLSVRQKSDQLRKKLNIPLNCKVAVTFSDMLEKSELTHVLRAFQKVAVKKPNTRLVIVGSGPFFKALEYEMLSLALGSKVIFAGAIPPYEVHDYIDLADAFISFNPLSAGFEPTTFEAMAQQKIIIGSDVGSLATIIDNTGDGFLIRPADTNSLSELLIDIFSFSANYENVGERARHKVLSLFDLKKLTQQTLDAYFQTLSMTRRFKKQLPEEKVMRP